MSSTRLTILLDADGDAARGVNFRHSLPVNALSVIGDTLFSGGRDMFIGAWSTDALAARAMAPLVSHTDWVTALVAVDGGGGGGGGGVLASASYDGTVKLWSAAAATTAARGHDWPADSVRAVAPRLRGTLATHTDYVTALAAAMQRVPAANLAFINSLVRYETELVQRAYKFGVLYVRDGQTAEDAMYANNLSDFDADDAAFERFLEFLGERVALQDFARYAGGLDTRKQSTGTHSIYAEYSSFEIMFHVAPYLPFQAADTQCIERKRHLGNDVVVLVYLANARARFDHSVIRSHFNCVFVVVRPAADAAAAGGDAPLFDVACVYAVSRGVHPARPLLPAPARFAMNDEARQFLLVKLINCERAARRGAREFKFLDERTRNLLLQELMKKI